jgi:chemotaxis protein MotB
MDKAYLGSAAVAAALVLGGCVTEGTYEKLEAEKAQEIAALQSQRSDLERQLGDLREQRAALEKDKVALEKDKTSLEREQASLHAQNEALDRERMKLLETSKQSQSQYDALVQELNKEVQQGQLQVRQYKDMLTVDVAEQLFFDSGRATLKDTGKDVLKRVADAIKSYDDKAIRVVGHTDNVPISGALQKTYASNWELSVARATTVVRFLQESGIEPERLVATGRAEYAPVAENESPEGRQKNRRIEITLINRNLF